MSNTYVLWNSCNILIQTWTSQLIQYTFTLSIPMRIGRGRYRFAPKPGLIFLSTSISLLTRFNNSCIVIKIKIRIDVSAKYRERTWNLSLAGHQSVWIISDVAKLPPFCFHEVHLQAVMTSFWLVDIKQTDWLTDSVQTNQYIIRLLSRT